MAWVSGAFPVASDQTPLAAEVALDKFGGAPGGFKIGGVVQYLCCPRECGNHKPVPSRDDLIVQVRARAFAAQIQKDATTCLNGTHDLLDGFPREPGNILD